VAIALVVDDTEDRDDDVVIGLDVATVVAVVVSLLIPDPVEDFVATAVTVDTTDTLLIDVEVCDKESIDEPDEVSDCNGVSVVVKIALTD